MNKPMFAMVALSLALSGCASIDVNTDYDPTTDFTAYQTFAWMEGTGGGSDDPRVAGDLMDQRFRRAIESELVSRGMRKLELALLNGLLLRNVMLTVQLSIKSWGHHDHPLMTR